jgi:outer membrane murein-binding lipoprotein Lpp
MSDMPQYDGGSTLVRNILIVAAAAYMIGSVLFMVQAQNRLTDMEKREIATQKEMAKKIDDNNGQVRATISVVADRVGLTQKELNKRAATLQQEENATKSRLSADEESTKQQFGQVNSEVTNVKGQVTRVSADVNDTRTDLQATKGKLESAIGDINKHSELIASTHAQLEQLRHRGDRDYIEFTLHKGGEPTHVASVSLQLKKVDPKKGAFTLMVFADDKKIEKKDRQMNEPLQFYSGRDRNLFEVVINAVDKDVVSGYLSAPKNLAGNAPSVVADQRTNNQ